MRYVQGASQAALRQASGLPGSDDRFHAPSAVVDSDGAFDVPGRFVKAALRAVLVVRLGVGFPRFWSCGSTRELGQKGHVVLDLVIIGLAITMNPLALVPSILILGSQKVRD